MKSMSQRQEYLLHPKIITHIITSMIINFFNYRYVIFVGTFLKQTIFNLFDYFFLFLYLNLCS